MPDAAGGVKRGDLSPPFRGKLQRFNEETEKWEAVDLTGATEIKLYLRALNHSNLVVEGAASIVGNPVEGRVEYQWESGDTAVADRYNGEVRFIKAGKPQTVPGVGYFDFEIEPNLGAAE